MKLYKRTGSPYWWYSFTANGKRYRGSTKRQLADQQGAKRFLSEKYNNALNNSQFGEKAEITLEDAFWVTLSEVSGQTKRLYTSASNHLFDFFGKEKLLSSLTDIDIEQYVSERKRLRKKANTIRGELKALFRAANRVAKTHKTNRDLEMPKLKGFVKTRYLTDAEEAKIVTRLSTENTITDQKALNLFLVLIDTGMRLREATNLAWEDIDTKRSTIEVYRPKTESLSLVPITQRVLKVFEALKGQEQPFEKMEWAIKHLNRVIDGVCNNSPQKTAQRGKATIHSLRDTYATRLRKRGMPLSDIAVLLGHTTAAMSAKYAHLESSDVLETARSLLEG
ncbi:site-specific integrase [Celeribacter sp. PS-C1]|uniref:tyrosine-type recombinase/integrase n=1 Tax=Celeribacter sp. PS-C1 TaxID=2820813 RepID=UPI001C66E6E5|nr:site-specific integrase [Celeribacter sp. PS-C1]MBW6417308.1 site-specific integrase [Celeribacter sp. PS-C1]